ncbi:hypothetical protein DSECCO2_487300 [anaerobic digester metagenome]
MVDPGLEKAGERMVLVGVPDVQGKTSPVDQREFFGCLEEEVLPVPHVLDIEGDREISRALFEFEEREVELPFGLRSLVGPREVPRVDDHPGIHPRGKREARSGHLDARSPYRFEEAGEVDSPRGGMDRVLEVVGFEELRVVEAVAPLVHHLDAVRKVREPLQGLC